MKILIVEDQVDLVKNMKQYLELEKFLVEVAYDGEEGEALLESELYDVIILDLNLPKKDGITLCKETREKGINTPILILLLQFDTVFNHQGILDFLNLNNQGFFLSTKAHVMIILHVHNDVTVGGMCDFLYKIPTITMSICTRT